MANNEFSARSDKDIREEIEQVLRLDEEVAGEMDSINITVENAHVYLRGTVSSLRIRTKIEDLIVNLPGVAFVTNDLEVKRR